MSKTMNHNSHNSKKPDFILKLKKTWNLKILTSEYAHEIESFIELFNDFFQLCEGENGSWTTILNACPPSKDILKDKFVLGLYDKNTLIGLIDMIIDYPKKGIWTIGYLLIHPKYRRQNLGSILIQDLEKAASPSSLRCIVQKQNTQALLFWKNNGFLVTSQTKEMFGKQENVIYVLEK